MTRQEIFDKVVAHFAVQRAPSVNEEGACLYRAEDGRKCAVGCLIPGEAYEPEYEGVLASPLLKRFPAKMESIGLYPADAKFLADIQSAHDFSWRGGNFLAEFSKAMASVARSYGVDDSSLVLLGERGVG